MNKSDERLMSYFFSIGFILLIALILVIFVVMSRFVLSDVNPIGAHVKETKDLLSDISEVEKAATKNIEDTNSTILIEREELPLIELNNLPTKITDVSYLNINDHKAIISFAVTNNFGEENGVYYLKINNNSDLIKNDVLAFLSFRGIEHGTLITQDNENELFMVRVGDKIERIPQDEILGKVIYVKE